MNDTIASWLAEDDDTEVGTIEVVKARTAFTVSRSVLLPLLSKAITVVPTRDVMPVLKCFQIDASPHLLRVIASDAETTLLVSTREVSTHCSGVAVFPAKKLLEIVKAAPAEPIKVDVAGTVATITAARSLWTLALATGADYPPMPALGDAALSGVDRQTFINAISAVRHAASRDPQRASLNIIEITGDKLTASDGTRIQQVTVPGLGVTMSLPIASVDDLVRLLSLSDEDVVYVGQSESKLIFRCGSDLLITSKYHATFPDMEAALLRPALENRHRLQADRAQLLAAIRRVRINADNDFAGIALSVEDNTLTVSTKDKYGNTAAETIDALWSGSPRTLVVHHGFLTEMINTYGDDTCCFRLGDDTKTRRSPLMLRNETTGSVGVTQQMQADWASR